MDIIDYSVLLLIICQIHTPIHAFTIVLSPSENSSTLCTIHGPTFNVKHYTKHYKKHYTNTTQTLHKHYTNTTQNTA